LVAFKLLEGSIGLILAVLPLLVVVIVLARVRPLEG
jgi:hypothetical protein